MDEVIVVNLFLWVRVFLVGGIFIMFPRITRKGLFFGVYVGEEFAESDGARTVMRSWDRSCGIVMASALVVGLIGTAAGNAVAGNLTGTVVLLLGCTGLFFRTYSKVKGMPLPDVAPQAEKATATLRVGNPKGETFAKISLVICLVVALATVIYAVLKYPSMGDRMPTLWSLIGGAEGSTEISYLTVLYVPSWNLVVSPLYALLALMVSTAKRSLREGPGSRSAEAQDAFRGMTANVFSGGALLVSALLTMFSVQVVHIALGDASSLGAEMLWPMGAIILGGLVSLFVMIRRFGQGGSRLEKGPSEGALTGGLADNTHWVGGVGYFNRDDPSLMVENRFGIGYTMNWGNRTSVVFTLLSLGLILSLIVLGFFL